MKAKDYFESIRNEVAQIERAREMIEVLRAKEGAKAQGYEPVGGGGESDPMGEITRRIDMEGRLMARIEESSKAVDEACLLLYGRDGRGGLAKLRGARYADAICMAYLQAEPWGEVAEIMRCSPKWCRELCNAGFVYIDRVGWAELKNA